MILDAFLQFDPAGTSVAIAAGTQVSTNVVDVGLNGIPGVVAGTTGGGGARDLGIGDDPALKLLVQVTTAFASAGSTGTIQAAFQFAPDNGSGVPGTYVTAVTGPSYVVPAVGAQLLNIDWPRPKDGLIPRYARILYTVAVQTMTAGAVAAYAVLDREDQPNQSSGVLGAYPAGITVAN